MSKQWPLKSGHNPGRKEGLKGFSSLLPVPVGAHMGKGSESGADGSWALPTPADKRQLQAEHGAANRRQLPLGMFSSATGIKKNFKKRVGTCPPGSSRLVLQTC